MTSDRKKRSRRLLQQEQIRIQKYVNRNECNINIYTNVEMLRHMHAFYFPHSFLAYVVWLFLLCFALCAKISHYVKRDRLFSRVSLTTVLTQGMLTLLATVCQVS